MQSLNVEYHNTYISRTNGIDGEFVFCEHKESGHRFNIRILHWTLYRKLCLRNITKLSNAKAVAILPKRYSWSSIDLTFEPEFP